MDFALSSEQQQLQATLARFIANEYGADQRRSYAAEAGGFSRAVWRRLADMGLPAVPFAEADGGIGGDGFDVGVIAACFGRGLVLEPYLATVVLAGGLIRLGASDA